MEENHLKEAAPAQRGALVCLDPQLADADGETRIERQTGSE
jgi:hypothetical protein